MQLKTNISWLDIKKIRFEDSGVAEIKLEERLNMSTYPPRLGPSSSPFIHEDRMPTLGASLRKKVEQGLMILTPSNWYWTSRSTIYRWQLDWNSTASFQSQSSLSTVASRLVVIHNMTQQLNWSKVSCVSCQKHIKGSQKWLHIRFALKYEGGKSCGTYSITEPCPSLRLMCSKNLARTTDELRHAFNISANLLNRGKTCAFRPPQHSAPMHEHVVVRRLLMAW